VLPPFRSRGHGTRLLQAVYDHARSVGALEVTVEDPNPQFRLVRDLTDARNCIAHGLLAPPSPSTAAPPTALSEARRQVLITEDQAARCYELQQYLQLRRQEAAVGDEGKREEALDELRKPWRLQVKKRLNKKHKEDLDALLVPVEQQQGEEAPDKTALADRRKARLEELFQQVAAEYDVLVQRLES